MNYYRFQVEQQKCDACGWVGTGKETERGETFESLFEVQCPVCGVKMGICTYPTRQEAEEVWDLVPAGDRIQFELQGMFARACEAHELKRADQLPSIDEPSFALVWDVEEREGLPQDWTVIRLGSRVIWSEPALYEGGERFAEIAGLLKQRYGAALVDLEPTRAAKAVLYGGRWSVPGMVDCVRAGLRSPGHVESSQ